MKLLISLFFIVTTKTFASSLHPILISYDYRYDEAQIIKNIIHNKTGIPLSLISVESTNLPCEVKHDSLLWHLCINNEGKLSEVSVDLNFIHKGIKIFKREEQK